MEAQYGKFLDMIRAVRINVPLIDVLAGMPNYGKFLKEIIRNKHKIEQISAAFLSDESSAMIQNKVPPKLEDPESFLIPCNFNKTFSCNALADLVGKFTFPADFVILEMEEDSKVPLILGRPFLHTADVFIRVKQKQLNLGAGTERMIFNIDSAMKHIYSNDDTYFIIDVINEILEEDFNSLLDEGSKILHSIEGTLLEEEIFVEFDEFMAMTADENSNFESDTEEPPFEKITINTNYKIKTSLKEPPTDLELKPLPDNLEYVFLEEPSFLPVIISSQLTKQKKNKLVYVLKKHKQAFAWKTTDIPGICPSFCKHKIQLLDDKKPVGIDFMGPFLKLYKFEYSLVAVDYVSKWAEAQALPTNDARVVITFLKKLFCHFGMSKALISDRGTHFYNKIMERTMKRYGVNHRFSTSYHPQTSGKVENTNRALKIILEKTVKDNPAIWLRKLDDALWAFRTIYKTPTGTTPYKLIYGKNYHLPFQIEHRAYWALKNCNPDLIAAGEKRMFQLHELDELRHQAYENSCLYKGNKYILVAVDYMSKWVEAQALPTNDARVVVKFLKGLFARFKVPKALISDRGTHFCNSQLKKALLRYGVIIEYQQHTTLRLMAKLKLPSELSNVFWKDRMVYGKACHQLVEIEHKAYWALKQCNMDLTTAAKNRFMELNELMELRDGAYENTRIYKERTKKWNDSRLRGDTDFKNGEKVLLFNSRLKLHPGKPKSK
ncbi:reverse transcriptase domain-containing protein [Tanacetum coccineum]